jgi:fimbrial chaperone protein
MIMTSARGRRRASLLLAAAGALCAAALGAAPAAAGSLQVDPIRLEISADRRIATLRIRNEEAVPATIRAYPLAWRQEGGEDVYEDSDALIVSPPIFTIPGGGTQIVRVGLRGAAGAGQSYRLIVEEVPEATPGGVQVALRLNLPLFAMLPEGRQADLQWQSAREGGRIVVTAVNRGAGPVRIDPASAAAAVGLAAPPEQLFGTVLPGSSRRWVIEPQAGAAGGPARGSRLD